MQSLDERLKKAVALLKTAEQPVAFTGAGISTESGLSDFRSPGGVWDRYRIVTYQEFLLSHDARVEYWNMKREFYNLKSLSWHKDCSIDSNNNID